MKTAIFAWHNLISLSFILVIIILPIWSNCQQYEFERMKKNSISIDLLKYGIGYERLLSLNESMVFNISYSNSELEKIDDQIIAIDIDGKNETHIPNYEYSFESKNYSADLQCGYRNYSNNIYYKSFSFFYELGMKLKLFKYNRITSEFKGIKNVILKGYYHGWFGGRYPYYDYNIKGVQTIENQSINHYSLAPSIVYGFYWKPTKLPITIESLAGLQYYISLDKKSTGLERTWELKFDIKLGYQF